MLSLLLDISWILDCPNVHFMHLCLKMCRKRLEIKVQNILINTTHPPPTEKHKFNKIVITEDVDQSFISGNV